MIKRIKSHVYKDARGALHKLINKDIIDFHSFNVSDGYISTSQSNVMRGLHRQRDLYGQRKLFSIILGKIILFAVDEKNADLHECAIYGALLDSSNPSLKTCIVSSRSYTGYLALESANVVACLADKPYKPDSEECISPLPFATSLMELYNISNLVISDKDRNAKPLRKEAGDIIWVP